MPRLFERFAEKKIAVAEALKRGEAHGNYSDGMIVLCSAISGIASYVWPGDTLDKKRFIELLVRFSEYMPSPKIISIPLFFQQIVQMEKDFDKNSVKKLKQCLLPYNYSRIIISDDVDTSEDDLLAVLQRCEMEFTVLCIRKMSYAALLYSELRCGLVHEYEFGENSANYTTTRREAAISYNNYSEEIRDKKQLERIKRYIKLNENLGRSIYFKRKIFFDLDWVAGTLRSIAANVDKLSEKYDEVRDGKWWIENNKQK